jgi:hypothetical protein
MFMHRQVHSAGAPGPDPTLHKVMHQLCEQAWALLLGHVPARLDHRQLSPGEEGGQALGVGQGHQAVCLPMDDEYWQPSGRYKGGQPAPTWDDGTCTGLGKCAGMASTCCSCLEKLAVQDGHCQVYPTCDCRPLSVPGAHLCARPTSSSPSGSPATAMAADARASQACTTAAAAQHGASDLLMNGSPY